MCGQLNGKGDMAYRAAASTVAQGAIWRQLYSTWPAPLTNPHEYVYTSLCSWTEIILALTVSGCNSVKHAAAIGGRQPDPNVTRRQSLFVDHQCQQKSKNKQKIIM